MIGAIRMSEAAWWKWIFAAWIALFAAAYGPTIERKALPVVTRFEIIQIEPDGAGSKIYVRFQKKRSCEYLGLNWNRIDQDGTEHRVLLNLKPREDASGSTRPVGKFVAGPWFVGMTPEQLRGHSRAVIAYRCHPFWITEIQVWP